MCKILMSINPKYVEEILSGNKKYEYRRTKAKKTNIDKIVIYSTSPIMKVVAEVEIEEILEDTPENIWKATKNHSGISKKFYMDYYKNKNIAIAYKLGKVIKYNKPLNLSDIGIKYTPQSFVYLDWLTKKDA